VSAIVAGMTDNLLRTALKLDALASGAMGVLLTAGAGLLSGPLGAPVPVLVGVGLLLVAFAAAVWVVATRPRISRPAVWTVIVLNLVWVVESIVFATGAALSGLGTVLVVAQAAAVVLFADLEFVGLRRAR
jgi:hypothetical protein